MPYPGEFAKHKSIRRLVENERVRNLLSRAKIRNGSQDESSLPKIPLSELRPSRWQPKLVVAIDGSYQQDKVENGYPGAEVGYVTVAGVMLDIEKMRNFDKQRPVDPKLFRTIENSGSIDAAFPGCNVVLDNETSPVTSLRKALFETFAEWQISPDGESLLDTYEVLLGYKSEKEPKCPYGECPASEKKYVRGKGVYYCPCPQKKTLYSTDALRIYEGMVPESSNGAMFAEIMFTLERILVIHILRWLEKTQSLWLLRHTGIILDGPLSISGHPAWVALAIDKELRRLNAVAKDFTDGQDILLIGVDKSGIFVNHFENLDKNKDGSSGAFPLQTVGLITDDYIKTNIIFSDSKDPYGSDTYFGRRFFYKTASGARIVASLPFPEHKDLTLADSKQYPRLADAMSILDQLVSSRYPNSLLPLVSANAEAAIPMNLGAQVLAEWAKKLIKQKS